MHDTDVAIVAEARKPSVVAYATDEKAPYTGPPDDSTEALLEPTQEELRTLRRVGGKIPWQSFTITTSTAAAIEFDDSEMLIRPCFSTPEAEVYRGSVAFNHSTHLLTLRPIFDRFIGIYLRDPYLTRLLTASTQNSLSASRTMEQLRYS
ncbi:hypothetical protein LTR97_009979 [Elasticomyces elasticus]|uniref:Uncharacterized protein n=1 Tax=Elasticomyces elasticus TaxID=574655 RepID=A0AAN7ZLM5_9PEZI|nr:hypothetical protein LTR97_009979 [Elasticomyces elasticus]